MKSFYNFLKKNVEVYLYSINKIINKTYSDFLKMMLLLSILIGIFTQMTNISAQCLCECQPLLLTPYIENGYIDEARAKSAVINLPNAQKLKSYSGYLTVNKQYDSNLFFWFFPALVRNEKI
jgi:hypothetical protein